MTDQAVVRALIQSGLTISTVESMTGGGLAEFITSIPGASKTLRGGAIVYSDEMKKSLLSIGDSEFPKEGAISATMAKLMVAHAFPLFKTDIVVSITGNAGPSAADHQPVGKVFIGLGLANQWIKVHQADLTGSRKQIREQAIKLSISLIRQHILGK